MQLRQIGTVRSKIKDRKSVPRLGAPASVELFAEYADGLLRFEKHSHVWVLAWLNEADRERLQVIPRSVTDRRPENLHGIFSVRSPVRPNPIGLTLGRVLRVEGAVIEFDRLDFMDGTPVIDLKPYYLARDMVFSATNVQIGRPASREALRETLLMQAVNFHGRLCPEVELAADICTQFRAEVLEMAEPAPLRVTVPGDRPQLADAFMGMTRATPGRGTLLYGESNVVRLECDGAVAEYELLPEGFRRRD